MPLDNPPSQADRVKELLAKLRKNIPEQTVLSPSPPQGGISEGLHKMEPIVDDIPISEETAAELLTIDSNLPVQNTQSVLLSSSTIVPVSTKLAPVEITLNSDQQAFSDLAFTGVDCVLIGAAGTGKTTSQRASLERLISTPDRIPKMQSSTRVLQVGRPGIAIVSFTRKAVNNIRKMLPDILKPHCFTLHALLEFKPVFYEIEDKITGKFKNTMRFEPARNANNPLPYDLKTIVFEEASMIGTDLYNLLHAALEHPIQEIFLGDIQQLPPVFGPAVLGFKMNQLPVVELKRVYRQALASPIIDTLWKILEGNPHAFTSTIEHYDPTTGLPGKISKQSRIRVPALDGLSRETEFGTLKFQVWQKTFGPEVALHTCIAQFKQWEQNGYYNPEEDVILCPFNKGFGTIELNKGISNYLSVKRGSLVYEVIAGFNKYYLAVGDRVLYDKEDAFIEEIVHNPSYLGKAPMPASVELDRYGVYQRALTEEEKLIAQSDQEAAEIAAAENFFDDVSLNDVEERVNAASHEVRIRIAHSDEILTLRAAGEINALLGGYAITVHKFQGSEADNVFVVFHNSHAIMLERELIYTALSRGKKRVHVICENNTFEKAIKRQAIKGNTLAEKAEFFKGKQTKGNDYVVPAINLGLPKSETDHWKNILEQSLVQVSEQVQHVSESSDRTENSGTENRDTTTREQPELAAERTVSLGTELRSNTATQGEDQVPETAAERASRILAAIRAKRNGTR